MAVFSAVLAAGAGHDPEEVLKRVTARILAAGKRIPNYTCVEAVQRDYFQPAAATLPRACPLLIEERRHPGLAMVLRPALTDRLHLDVAMVQGGEIFSWVGASKFDDAGIFDLVRFGPIATGAFAGYLVVIFEQDVKTFTFTREIVAGGRSLIEYSFQVASAHSHYKVRAGDSWFYIGYSGTIQVDPETDEVVRLTVRTADLPEAANSCETLTSLDFGMAHIGGVDFPLPTRSRQRFVIPDGEEVENTTTFANCREYKGESTITFDETAPAADGAAPAADPTPRNGRSRAPSPRPSVPENRRFTLELTAPIQTDTVAAGDPFTARLAMPLRDAKGKLLAPAGTPVAGRLLRVEIFHKSPQEVILALKPDTMDIKGVKVPLAAVRDWSQIVAAARNSRKRGVKILLPLKGEEHAGVFQFPGEHPVVKKGFRSDWRTVR